MKITRTISIKPEVWLEAIKKTNNLSGTIELLLEEWSKAKTDREDVSEIERIEADNAKLAAENAKMAEELKKIKEKEGKVLWRAQV